MSLGAFLNQAGAVLRGGLPSEVWIEAAIVAVRPNRFGYTFELTDSGPGGAAAARLQVFAAHNVFAPAPGSSAVDPALLVGMTTSLKIRPTFSARWGLQGRVSALSQDARASLERARLTRLRADLKVGGLFDRQRRLKPPRDVTRLVVVHPQNAAGFADIEAELARWQKAGLLLFRSCPATFDGDRAATALVAALTEAVRPFAGAPPDLIAIVRGGGAAASLAVLDCEPVVRAVCACPVPIVVGLGHAIDSCLVDEVAWASVDTPSKVRDVIRRLFGQPAAAAITAMSAIDSAARQHLTEAHRGLDLEYSRCLADAGRQGRSAADDLGRVWTNIRLALSAVHQAGERLRADAEGLWQEIRWQAPASLSRHSRDTSRHRAEIVREARRHLVGFDGGRAPFGAVLDRAQASIGAQRIATRRQIDAVASASQARLAAAEAELAEQNSTVEASDIGAVLRRGFTLAVDRAGRLLRSGRAARSARDLTLIFCDGAVAAVVDAPTPSHKGPTP